MNTWFTIKHIDFFFFFFKKQTSQKRLYPRLITGMMITCASFIQKKKQKLPENSLTNLTGIKRNCGSSTVTDVYICSASHFTVFASPPHSNCIYVVITTVLYLLTAHIIIIIIWDLFLLHLKLIDYLMCSIKNSPCLVSSLQVGRLGAPLHMLPQQVYVAHVLVKRG